MSHHPTVEARDTTVMTSLRLLAVLDVRSSTPARAKRLAPRPDGPLTHFASPSGETCRLTARGKSHAGGVTRLWTDCVLPSRFRKAAPRSARSRAEAARNPSGDGHLRSSALSFAFPSQGGDHPDRHPPHSAPRMSRSPSRLPRDFYHELLTLFFFRPGRFPKN